MLNHYTPTVEGMSTMSVRSDLRQTVIEISGGTCEYPNCRLPGTQLAHAHSIGMGGRKSADTLSNVTWLCDDHALLSDGLIPSHGAGWYIEQLALIGVDYRNTGERKAWHIAEMLRSAVARERGFTTHSPPPGRDGL